MQDKEKEPVTTPEGLEEIQTPEDMEMKVPSELERAGVKPTKTQFTNVTDDQGQPLTQTPQDQVMTVQVPASQAQLDDWSKDPPSNARRWFAITWIRRIKQAFHFGWKLVSGKKDE